MPHADHPDQTDFASVLNGLMASRGLHQAALARELGVWDANVGRWRRGAGIGIENVRKIAAYFGVDRAYMEALAGYGDKSLITDASTDPDMDALLAADRREVHEDFAGIPPMFWPSIMAAQRQVRRLMTEQLRVALGQDNAQDISPKRRVRPQEAPGSSALSAA